MKSAKMPGFSLINLDGMSVFCVALFACKHFFPFKISFLPTYKQLQGVLEIQFSLKAQRQIWDILQGVSSLGV